MCAEGFIEEAAEGRVLRMDDLMRFVRAVYDEDVNVDDPRVGHVCTAIEGAAARWLARKGGNSMRDIFGGASKMHESLTFLGAVGRAHPSSASGLPLPVPVAAQRILGTEADLFGKPVVVPRAGTGAIRAHLPHGATLRPRIGRA